MDSPRECMKVVHSPTNNCVLDSTHQRPGRTQEAGTVTMVGQGSTSSGGSKGSCQLQQPEEEWRACRIGLLLNIVVVVVVEVEAVGSNW